MTQTSDAGPGPGPAPPTERSDRAAALAARRRLRRRNTAIAVVFALVLCLFAAVTAVNALTDIGPFTAPPERTVDTAAAPPAEVVAPPVDGASPPAPAPAPAPAPPPPPPPVAFSTPTGNIGCSLTPDGARCDIVDRAWDPGPPPADCAATWGAGVQVGPQGAGLVCAADSVLGTAAPLDYGAVSEVGTFRCTSTEAGVRCEDLATGRGFALARTSYTLF